MKQEQAHQLAALQLHRITLNEGNRPWDMILVRGQVLNNRSHRHHALQVCWSYDKAATLTLESSELQGHTLVVDGGVAHALKLSEGATCLVPRESPLANSLRQTWLQGRTAAVVQAPQMTRELTFEAMVELLTKTLPQDSTPLEPRVQTVLEWLDELEEKGAWTDVTLEGALKQVHLSEDRFRHIWTEAMGTPWRTYLTWRRALVALTLANTGHSLTETAHLTGYADSAHLSRQVVQHFGFPPSHILKVSRFVQGDGR